MKTFPITAEMRWYCGIDSDDPAYAGWAMLQRDLRLAFQTPVRLARAPEQAEIVIDYSDTAQTAIPEQFTFTYKENQLCITAADSLGLIYGMLHLSRAALGVAPFWFWTDRPPRPREKAALPAVDFVSPEPAFRYRGWFVNDECLLTSWKEQADDYTVWSMVFECLLRCGGNMIIPGTFGINHTLAEWAAEIGLWITHHHCEPLNAPFFKKVYPGVTPILSEQEEAFCAIWRETVRKNRDQKTVWTLGLRGQGDYPYWDDDPSCDTPQKRGAIVTRAVSLQYDIVRQECGEVPCCAYIYGELTELYHKGYLQFPAGVIKVWSDNGYGKMVARRTNAGEAVRQVSLPRSDDPGPHGVYYHVTFHDSKAANHLTMLPNSAGFVADELAAAKKAGADHYLLVNCGNIRPHAYFLDLIRQFWNQGAVDPDTQRIEFVNQTWGDEGRALAPLLEEFSLKPAVIDEKSGEKAGDQFYFAQSRLIMSRWINGAQSNEPEAGLSWITGEAPFDQQTQWFERICRKTAARWEAFEEKSLAAARTLSPGARQRAHDLLGAQITIHAGGARAMALICQGLRHDREKRHAHAYLCLSRAIEQLNRISAALKKSEHDHWQGFYNGDNQTNVAATRYWADAVRRWIRACHDGPRLNRWNGAFGLLADVDDGWRLSNRLVEDTSMTHYLEKTIGHEIKW